MSTGYTGETAPKPVDKTSTVWVNNLPTNYAWANLVLKNIGAPQTENNIQNLLLWMSAENKPSNWATRNNPLNASLNTGSVDGTGSYDNLTTAATNTAAMIVYGGKNKNAALGSGIYEALMSNAPTDKFSQAVVNSNWSSNHYGVAAAGSLAAVPGRAANWFKTIPLPSLVAVTTNGGDGYRGNISAALHVPGCAEKGNAFGGVLGLGKISYCNLKAFQGGLLVVGGGILILVGLNLVTKNVASNAIIQAIPEAGTVKKVAEMAA